ncbi:LysR family transcriptional regulator [Telmatospirillum siberiense]|uniref:LysR family transcriptional regulator n=1 Tax=Telmatospirillum siberiense TaxID=382514 RepID=A0A2N3PUU4_9PROT|nr:LysR family transcriptional regulator [Telmatospirillum siberiense]PKU24171.1 LysR family transcriptional regulator [Telmatospirillum siberiense]
MELSWLEDFLALANCANFSRAAELRNMTQPALSRRIRALEDWVGAPLFDRTHQPVALTEAGRIFHPSADEALRRLFQSREECREVDGQAGATLRFAATHSLSLTFFPSWLRSLEDRGPFGAVRLISDSLQACEQVMLQGQAQFLLCHCHPAVPGRLGPDLFQSRLVGRDRLLPVSAPMNGTPRYALETAEGPIPCLAYNAESGLGRIVAAAPVVIRARSCLEPIFTSHLAAVLRALALEGRGVAWLPYSVIEQDLHRGVLVRAAGESWDIDLEIRLFRSLAKQSLAAEQFWMRLNEDREIK